MVRLEDGAAAPVEEDLQFRQTQERRPPEEANPRILRDRRNYSKTGQGAAAGQPQKRHREAAHHHSAAGGAPRAEEDLAFGGGDPLQDALPDHEPVLSNLSSYFLNFKFLSKFHVLNFLAGILVLGWFARDR